MKLRTNLFFWNKKRILNKFNKNKKFVDNKEKEAFLENLFSVVKLTGEKKDDTQIRIFENYLYLIMLIKTYKLVIKDAKYWRTTTRIDQAFFLGTKKIADAYRDVIIELDGFIQEDMPKKYDGREDHLWIENARVRPYPVLELDKLLILLEKTNYDNVIDKMIVSGIIKPSQREQLKPNTVYGTLALQVFHTSLSIVESFIRELVDKEEAPYPPKNQGQFYERLDKKFEELKLAR